MTTETVGTSTIESPRVHDDDGKFAKGNKCGRKPGVPNKAATDIRIMRQRLLDSWDVVDGDKLLREIAISDPAVYLKIIAGLLPKALDVDIDARGDVKIVFLRDDSVTPPALPEPKKEITLNKFPEPKQLAKSEVLDQPTSGMLAVQYDNERRQAAAERDELDEPRPRRGSLRAL